MIKAVTGTKDILPSDIPRWNDLEERVKKTFARFNYREIRTPIFELTQLFARGIGEATDIVSKEMYTFLDRSEESITLRPEMTAGVVRAFVEHSLHKQHSLNKLFYMGPMFRQERPQAGRFRQFHQFGAEALGSHDPLLDAEMIIMAYNIIRGLELQNIKVKINSLGTPPERERYRVALRNYLEPFLGQLTEESRKRFNTNVLRIFDSKDERDNEVMKSAPLLIDYLDFESRNHFEKVKSALQKADVPCLVDGALVRGLDYYTHTTFEVVSGSVGSQSALCGGGRYNGLIKELGGPDLPGVGFAAGMERILLAVQNENFLIFPDRSNLVYVVTLDDGLNEMVFNYVLKLRGHGLEVEMNYDLKSMKGQLREANRLKAKWVIFYGGTELMNNEIVLKNMKTGFQETLQLEDVDSLISRVDKDYVA